MARNSAIPTVYKGIQFRSRLEARWAAFFDELGWPYQYEPCDFEGWIPDFALTGGQHPPVFVEVKPVFEFPKDVAAEIDATSCKHEVVILGTGMLPASMTNGLDLPGIGWLGTPEDSSRHWTVAAFGAWPDEKYLTIGFTDEIGGWGNRAGKGAGKYYNLPASDVQKIVDLRWTKVGNMTQWKGKQSVTR